MKQDQTTLAAIALVRSLQSLHFYHSETSYESSSDNYSRLRNIEYPSLQHGGEDYIDRLGDLNLLGSVEDLDEVQPDGDIEFANTTESQEEGDPYHDIPKKRRGSLATISSTPSQRASIHTVGGDHDDEVEDIPRDFPSKHQVGRTDESMMVGPVIQKSFTHGLGTDYTLFIKMSLHPLSLSTYLSGESVGAEEQITNLHCFHTAPSVQLLLRLLDGIEYIHTQGIVHRDLKPANVFLSISENRMPSLTGFVEASACPECVAIMKDENEGKAIYVTPCIGDFGLIAELKHSGKPSTNLSGPGRRTSNSPIYEPSPLATIAPKPVGTQFYRPPYMPSKEPIICEKLDVFSLGVIAFELVWKFTTKSERAIVLGNLNKGQLPVDWLHPFRDGIEGMTCSDRDSRWDTKMVRKWLTDML